ncbi:MAG: hypothetical protein H7338_02230, partial [Candidatus Sericytochromatia bacterium]|nr:hypothetical protein [Candidatus Sericytochromatia bacterium]
GKNVENLGAKIERYKSLTNDIVSAQQSTDPGDKAARLTALQKVVKGEGAVNIAEGNGAVREDKVRQARSNYLVASDAVDDARTRGAGSKEIKHLERAADDALEAIVDARGHSWRDGLAEFFGGAVGAQVANGLKYMMEQLMELAKQRQRVSQLGALYAQAVAEEQKLTADIAMYAMPQGTHK